MYFTKKIKTKLSPEEVMSRMKSITINNTIMDGSYEFEGDITINSFRILPLFNYGYRQLLRPEVLGEIKMDDNNESLINLTFQVSSNMRNLLIGVFIFNIVIIFFKEDLFHLSVLFLTYLIFYQYLLLKARKSLLIIEQTLDICAR